VCAISVNGRQVEVRVDIGVAVTGEVLAGAHQTFGSRAANVGPCKAAHELRILAEGPCIDDRVKGIGVDVEHWPKNHVDADRPRLGAEHLPQLVREIVGAGGAERHDRREHGSATLREERRKRVDVAQSHAGPVLHVGRDEKRNSGADLELVQLGGVAEWKSDREDESSYAVILNPFADLLEFLRAHGGVITADPRHYQLPDLRTERERGERAVDPALISGRERSARSGAGGSEELARRRVDPGDDGRLNQGRSARASERDCDEPDSQVRRFDHCLVKRERAPRSRELPSRRANAIPNDIARRY